jgi:peptide/nickel transport system substrate-binding protein
MNCDISCIVRARTVFESLFNSAEGGSMQPSLATGYEVNDDATEFTVTLREGVTFHDGTPFNAEAAVTNFVGYINSGLTGRGLVDVARKPDGSPDIEILDDATFRVRTSRPWYEFPRYWTGYVASPTWLAEVAADPSKATQPVGTGPFRFVSWRAGENMVVERNPDYWQKDAAGNALPYLDRVEFKVIPDENTRLRALQTGAIDLMATDSGENIETLRGEDDLVLTEQTAWAETYYILQHVGQPGSPLQDKRVRCGLRAATNTEQLAEVVGAGVFPVANGPFSPTHDGYLEDNGNPGYDLEEARRLLGEYAAETGQKPKIIFSTVPDQGATETAALVQQMWQEAGAEVQIEVLEQSTLILNALLGDPAFNAFGWRNHGAGPAVDQQYVWWHKSTSAPPGQLALNFGRLDDPVLNDLLDQQRSEPDPARRAAIAQDINRRFAEECWIIPTTWTVWGMAHTPEVRGLDDATFPDSPDLHLHDGNGGFWLSNAWLSED